MYPKFRLVTDGKCTYAEIGGKTIGKGVVSCSFSHDAEHNEKPKLFLEIDLDDFEFMEDVHLDDVTEKMKQVGENPIE